MAGNLGNYQRMVAAAKRLGGPGYLALAIGVAGYGVLRVVEAGVRGGARALRAQSEQSADVADLPIYRVTEMADAGGGLLLAAGDELRVLRPDDESVLIEVVGKSGNPWVVSAGLLAAVSTWSPDVEEP